MILVTGSSGHLGEAIVRTIGAGDVRSVDIQPGEFTSDPGDIRDRDHIRKCLQGVTTVYHAATLHKPHVATHSTQDFIDTNISATAMLLEEAVRAGVRSFIFTSTTSVYGEAMQPRGGEPAIRVTESVSPVPKNIYGVTKLAAENLCRLAHREHGLNVLVLRTSRFFPEEDDARERRDGWDQNNVKANEFLFRRVELSDCVSAHLCAAARAPDIGFGRFVISATSPFLPEDLADLRSNPAAVVSRRVPGFDEVYERLGWRMFDDISRVYINDRARAELGWRPRYSFADVLALAARGEETRSELARAVGAKGYHDEAFDDGPYPVKPDYLRQEG